MEQMRTAMSGSSQQPHTLPRLETEEGWERKEGMGATRQGYYEEGEVGH